MRERERERQREREREIERERERAGGKVCGDNSSPSHSALQGVRHGERQEVP